MKKTFLLIECYLLLIMLARRGKMLAVLKTLRANFDTHPASRAKTGRHSQNAAIR